MVKMESYGIDAIPSEARSSSWWGLFVMQASMALSFPTLVIGLLLVPALSSWQVTAVNVFANLLLASLVALMGYFGVDHAIPGIVSSRYIFGFPWGSHLCSLLLVISMIGWYAVTEELAGLALNGILESATGFSAPLLLIFLVGVLNVIPALIGFDNMKLIGLVATVALSFLSVWIMVAALRLHAAPALTHYKPTGEISMATAIDWVVSGFIAGAYIASDYSRHIRTRRGNWAACLLGVAPPSILLTAAGIVARLATGHSEANAAIRALGLGIPGLVLVVLSTVPSLETLMYSGGIAATNLFPRHSRWVNTLWLGAFSIALACLRVTQHLGDFLSALTYVFSPIIGISLANYFIVRRCRLPLPATQQRAPLRVLTAPLVAAALGVGAGYLSRAWLPVTLSSLLVSAACYLVLRLLPFLNSESSEQHCQRFVQ